MSGPEIFSPRAYQKRAIDFVKNNKRAALWLSMGLGKTAVVLSAISELANAGKVQRVLIVAPKRVALFTWPAEVRKWKHTRKLQTQVITGPEKQKQAMLERPALVQVTNYEQLLWLDKYFGPKRLPWDMIVFDESSKMKSPQARRFKAMRGRMRYVDRVVTMTGTPAPNSLLDVWAQTYLLDQGERLFKSVYKFKEAYFISDYMGYSWTLKPGADKRIVKKLEDITLTMDAKDYMELPPQVNNIVSVPLTASLLKQYRELERELVLELDTADITAVNAAAALNKASQFANGAVYDEDHNWHEVHKSKLEALDDIVEEAAGAPLLVAYQYRHDLARLQVRYPQSRTLSEDPQVIDDWNAGKIPILLAHPGSAGHGLNLQHGGNTVVWFGLTWNLEHYMQLIERVGPTRQAQSGLNRPVIVHHLVVAGTVDEAMYEVLANKRSVQDALMTHIKRASNKRAA